MNYEINQSHDAILRRPRALALGALLSYSLFEATATIASRRRRSSEPVVTSSLDPNAKRSGLYIPGYHANGAVIGGIIEKALPAETNWHVVSWGESGARTDIAGEKVHEALQHDDGLPLSIHASSWGFHPLSDWMSNAQFREALKDRNVTITGGSNFYDTSDINWKLLAAMHFTRVLPPLFSSDHLFKKVMSVDDTDITVHEQGVDDAEVAAWKASSANAPYGAARDQVRDILGRQGNYLLLSQAYQDIAAFRYISAEHDPVTNVHQSFAKIRSHLGEKATHWINTDYPNPSHAMEPAFRSSLVKLMFYGDEQLAEVPNLQRKVPLELSTNIDQTRQLALAG